MPFVESGSAQLACTTQGSGPAILLLHAGVTDRRSWTPLVEHLGHGYQTISYDRRGFGDTSCQPEPHREVADALAVLDAQRVDAAVVIGASNGGRHAIDLALSRPDRVRALVLIGSAVSGAPDEDPATFAEPVQRLYAAYERAEAGDDLAELNRVEAHAWLDGWSAPEGRVTGAVRDLFLAMNHVALHAPDPGPAEATEPAWDRVASIRLPALVLCGDLDVLSFPSSRHLAEQIPGAAFEVLAATGHLPHLEGHPRCLDAIRAFVADVTR